MSHALSDLMTRLGLVKPATDRSPDRHKDRHVMVHVTIDAQHATSLRRALVRDCAGEPWTIRVTPLHNRGRVRLTLILPKKALDGAINRLSDVAPSARVSGLLEVPDTPSEAWRNLMENSVSIGSPNYAPSAKAPVRQSTLPALLTPMHILLDANVTDRDGLFRTIADFFANRHGITNEAVFSCLAQREALGSTALGEGVALPHGQLDELSQATAFYIRLCTPIPYAAPDGKPISDVIALFVPERTSMTHLHLLGEVAQHFCDHQFRELLHQCQDVDAVSELFAAFSSNETPNGPETGAVQGQHFEHGM